MCVFRLNETKAELEDEKRQSTSTKMFSESEVRELRAKYVTSLQFFFSIRYKMIYEISYVCRCRPHSGFRLNLLVTINSAKLECFILRVVYEQRYDLCMLRIAAECH